MRHKSNACATARRKKAAAEQRAATATLLSIFDPAGIRMGQAYDNKESGAQPGYESDPEIIEWRCV
jgi:hypothetical protein